MARLSDEEIEERRAGLDRWERSGDAIVKQFDNGDFKGSVEFVNRLTPEAEEMNHHPDLEDLFLEDGHGDHHDAQRGRPDGGRFRACAPN